VFVCVRVQGLTANFSPLIYHGFRATDSGNCVMLGDCCATCTSSYRAMFSVFPFPLNIISIYLILCP